MSKHWTAYTTGVLNLATFPQNGSDYQRQLSLTGTPYTSSAASVTSLHLTWQETPGMYQTTENPAIPFFLSCKECKSVLSLWASVYREAAKVSQACRLENLTLTVITLILKQQNCNLQVSEWICRVVWGIPLLLSLTPHRKKFHRAPWICTLITMLPSHRIPGLEGISKIESVIHFFFLMPETYE